MLIVDGKKYEVDGLKTISWLDEPGKVKYVTDKNVRTKRVQGIVCHTTKGILGKINPGFGPSKALSLVRYQVNTDRYVSWDYTVDMNGDVYCQNDPMKHFTWQAGDVNDITLGIEFVQEEDGDLFQGQIEKGIQLIDALTYILGIQRQIPWDHTRNECPHGIVPRIEGPRKARDFVGVFGHRHQTKNRGVGDPGDHIFNALASAGYEKFDLNQEEDLRTWKSRQLTLGIGADGFPGNQTVRALKERNIGFNGIWITRPTDSLVHLVSTR